MSIDFRVEASSEMVSDARRLNPKAAFKQAPGESLPFPDQTADLVFSSLSFHHWIDHQRGIQEIARVLRPGGWFCLADHTFLITRLWGENVQSRQQIRAYMAGAGLAVRRQRMLWIRYVMITLAQK